MQIFSITNYNIHNKQYNNANFKFNFIKFNNNENLQRDEFISTTKPTFRGNKLAAKDSEGIILTPKEIEIAEKLNEKFDNRFDFKIIFSDRQIAKDSISRLEYKEIEHNIVTCEAAFQKYGIDWPSLCAKEPMLLIFDGEHARKSIEGVVNDKYFKNKGLTVGQYIEAATKKPQLFCQNPETIRANIERVVNDEYFKNNGLTAQEYIKAATKQPSLFCQNPETIRANIERVVNDKYFKDNGLTAKKYIKAATKQPSLFCQNPETIRANIERVVNDEYFKTNGLTAQEYIEATTKKPQLFCQNPETIRANIERVVNDEYFKTNGLTAQEYIEAAIKQPSLFSLKPKTIKDKIMRVVADEYFKNNGLTAQEYIEAAVKQPSLFTLTPKTIKEHIEIYDFILKDKLYQAGEFQTAKGKEIAKEIIERKNLGFSSKYLYFGFLRSKMFPKGTIVPQELKDRDNLVKKMQEYIKNLSPIEKYSFDIIEHPKAQAFIDFVQQYSKTHFDIKIIRR